MLHGMSPLLALLACADAPPPESRPAAQESPPPAESPAPSTLRALWVTVTLDGEPVEGATLSQGGRDARWTTDAQGQAQVLVDLDLDGDRILMASHPDARIGGEYLPDPEDTGEPNLTIALTSFDRSDNRLYTFQDPGEPTRQDSANQCAHCHVTINAAWYSSPHRSSARNPHVQDLYAGAASGLTDEAACADAGGRWWVGLQPGTGDAAARCYLGAGTLPDLNPGCDTSAPCDGQVPATGACADCHAPGIDGALGGRDLLEARGFAYDYGVHCDVCHKVESVDLDAEAGVAGRLHLLRPTEEQSGPLGPWQPLTFGPYTDVLNPRMGSVARELYHEATLCAGCHELHQPALVPGQSVDPTRWPTGRLPIHTTYSEWATGPFAPDVICQSCHMPADADVGNSADLGNEFPIPAGVAGGWYRAPGQVREHSWAGPRQPELGMLDLAAFLTQSTSLDGGVLTVQTTVQNSGPAHALPTGEPLRAVLLVVRAWCGDTALSALSGPAVPDYGGGPTRPAGEDWTRWPQAQVGQVLRVTRLTGAWLDYSGYGAFGDGTFSAAQKGLAEEVLVGEVRITAIAEDGEVTTDAPLPSGDRVYLGDAGWPSDNTALALAGAPGFAWARVLADATGARMVPHHRAVDVVSDNRLLPQAKQTLTHTFAASCEDPRAEAVLVWRPLPLELAQERGWAPADRVMAEVGR